MQERFSRTALLIGEDGVDLLSRRRVAVFGIGGVGGHALEALARSGIGAFDLVDSDRIAASNINRQIIALESTIGKYKVDAARDRVLDINPSAAVKTHKKFFLPENACEFDFSSYDYVIDATDTVTAKIAIVEKAREANIPVISSMGAGNKLDPTAFEVADIFETSVCPLARVMRRELKKRGIESLKVVYSKEMPLTPRAGFKNPGLSDEEQNPPEQNQAEQNHPQQDQGRGREIPGSMAFVPSVAGLIIAGEVVKDLLAGGDF